MINEMIRIVNYNWLCDIQGWRVCYYGAGIVGLIIAFLTAFTLTEPERESTGEEATGKDGKKIPMWKVILQPRIILLCLAASIRHCGEIL